MTLILNKMDFIREVMAKYFGCNKYDFNISLDYRTGDTWHITAINLPYFNKESANFKFIPNGNGWDVTVCFDFNPNHVIKVG